MSRFSKHSLAAVVVFFTVLLHPTVAQGQSLSVTTLAGLAGAVGSTDGTGSAARFFRPDGVATDSSGNVYVADEATIRKITPGGTVTTLAGLAGNFGSADGTGNTARFNRPVGVATDSNGNVYVADTDNSTIRKITPAGVVTTFAGLAGIQASVDGTVSVARFNLPRGVATDSSGNVYVADSGNSTIRKISLAGDVTTLAGLAGGFGSVDGTATAARFNRPVGLATDSSGNVYVADTSNSTIRKITPAGVVTTLAGLALNAGSADGSGSAARFSLPFGVATDGSGNVYVADTSNTTIRKITPAGAVTTVAGLAGTGGSTDGIGSAARFNQTRGVATDSTGKVYIGDFNATVRVGVPLFASGDANGDGGVAAGDIFYLINNLFASGPAPIGPGDANGDAAVTAGDIFYLINFLFAGGPAPL